MKNVTPAPRREPSRLLLGVVLMVLGVGLFLLNFGILPPRSLWNYYPFPLLILGVVGIAFPSRHLTRSAGLWLLASGLYGICGVYNPFGLGWMSAWPLFVIAAGADFAFSRSNWAREPGGVSHEPGPAASPGSARSGSDAWRSDGDDPHRRQDL